MRGLFDIGLGLVFLIGGLTGKLALIGTNSGIALAAVGGAMIAWGGYKAMQGAAAGPTKE